MVEQSLMLVHTKCHVQNMHARQLHMTRPFDGVRAFRFEAHNYTYYAICRWLGVIFFLDAHVFVWLCVCV